ncbi:hypothetical protein ACFE04_028194 [Oxalis oulophora]
MEANNNKTQNPEQYGVLLYYKYAQIPNLDSLLAFYESNCNSLSLLGRVRLAPDGVNATLGGLLTSLEKHIAAVKLNDLFDGTDFKLASCQQPLNDAVARECGFASLSIRAVKELVSLISCYPLSTTPQISDAGKHLSADEFHSLLQAAKEQHSTDDKKLVLVDARNLYETRIGKFHTPNVDTLDPEIRQYSDLPSWIDNNSEQLRGKNVLMYCTGGIRCEMASAYLRSKGAGFENVFQLYGGIQRYLEQFPDGGFFQGKNFVFDHRISVGSTDEIVIGSCLLCGCSFDDYSPRCRCTHCRMLVLVCNVCQIKGDQYVCELCQRHGKGTESMLCSINVNPQDVAGIELKVPLDQMPQRNGNVNRKKLRILCLHGFRQNASSFKGRTSSLAKKLKQIAELVFINAPHELQFIYQPSGSESINGCNSTLLQHNPPPPIETCKKKFAWLVAPSSSPTDETDWKTTDRPFDPLQYLDQTEGFDQSLTFLKKVFSEEGPFDGILGFSQGAAMAALVCAQREKLHGEVDFRFAILCSGFAVKLNKVKKGSINCPSLHIFGSEPGKDRQIANNASRELASLFEDGCSVVIEHDSGHIVPTRSPYIDEIKEFLQRFL